jgi:hypothetical protein
MGEGPANLHRNLAALRSARRFPHFNPFPMFLWQNISVN